ncbi:hypothetical protein T492DRAFT_884489 [Pavlovales sp. CCMP2436]|nr:hypothetical protein T492DRAFT_884489 [Pavlovales sp. CCMP2436]
MVFPPAHERWRKHPHLNQNWKIALPGLGYAVVIFTSYMAVEAAYNLIVKPKKPLWT